MVQIQNIVSSTESQRKKMVVLSTVHENWQTHRVKCAFGRERENAAGKQRKRMRKRGRLVVTVRIISNVSSHSNISVGAVTFSNTGKSGPVNPELVSGMAGTQPQAS